jgi:hypothetical protein
VDVRVVNQRNGDHGAERQVSQQVEVRGRGSEVLEPTIVDLGCIPDFPEDNAQRFRSDRSDRVQLV